MNITLVLLTMLKLLGSVVISVDHFCDRWWIGPGWLACVELDKGIIHLNAGYIDFFDEYQWTNVIVHELAHLKFCGRDEACARRITRIIDEYCFWCPWKCGIAIDYYCKIYGKVAEILRKDTYIDAYLRCMDFAYYGVRSKLLYGPLEDLDEAKRLWALALYILLSELYELFSYYSS